MQLFFFISLKCHVLSSEYEKDDAISDYMRFDKPLSESRVHTSLGFPIVNVALQSYLTQEMEKLLLSPVGPIDFHKLLDFLS